MLHHILQVLPLSVTSSLAYQIHAVTVKVACHGKQTRLGGVARKAMEAPQNLRKTGFAKPRLANARAEDQLGEFVNLLCIYGSTLLSVILEIRSCVRNRWKQRSKAVGNRSVQHLLVSSPFLPPRTISSTTTSLFPAYAHL